MPQVEPMFTTARGMSPIAMQKPIPRGFLRVRPSSPERFRLPSACLSYTFRVVRHYSYRHVPAGKLILWSGGMLWTPELLS